MPRAERAAWFEEALPLLRRLLTEDEITHVGPRFRLERVTVRPRPRKPLDIWSGGSGRRELERTGRLADGWLPSFVTPAAAAAGRRVIQEAAASAGREIEDEHYGALVIYSRRPLSEAARQALRRRPPRRELDIDQLVPVGPIALGERIAAFIEVGVSKFVLRPAVPPDSIEDELESLAGEVLELQGTAAA